MLVYHKDVTESAIEFAAEEIDTMAEYLLKDPLRNTLIEALPSDFFYNIAYYRNIGNVKKIKDSLAENQPLNLIYLNNNELKLTPLNIVTSKYEFMTEGEKIVRNCMAKLSAYIKLCIKMNLLKQSEQLDF